MQSSGLARSRSLAFLAAIILAAVMPPAAAADVDTTPPVGVMTERAGDIQNHVVNVGFAFSDSESGVTSISVTCDNNTAVVVPYQAELHWLAHDPSGGCPMTYARHLLQFSVINGAGLSTYAGPIYMDVQPTIRLEAPLPAITGQPFTLRPVFPDDFVIPATADCTWEFRWGDTRSLASNNYDETFGAIGFGGTPAAGFCGDWTFTLPWVPVRQFQVALRYGPTPSYTVSQVTSGFVDDGRGFITAAVGSTDRRITASNLPIVQVLPSTYTPIVGQPVTYTRYLIAGASSCCRPEWTAWQGSGDHPTTWHQNGGATFTFTPTRPGDITVGWQPLDRSTLLYALYDPPARYRDRTRPNTTAPAEKVGGAVLGALIPVTLTWSGTDRGWGIASYNLQQSVNGGTWTTIRLPSAKTLSVVRMVTPGVSIRYRVRATDKAGNVGYWDYGPRFKPWIASEGNAGVAYAGPWTAVADTTAQGGLLRTSSTAGARATFTFTGRDVGWFAEKGPGHGTARVYVDGVPISTINLNASVDQPRRIVFRWHWSTVRTHRLRIVVSGTGLVDVDAFVVLR